MLFAVAPITSSANDVAEWLLLTIGIVFVFAVLAALVIQFARRRRRRHVDVITAAVVIWGIVAAASVSYFFMRKMDWDTELQQKIYSGDYDLSDTADRPNAPIALWCALGIGYVALIGWSASGAPIIDVGSTQAGEQKV